MQILKFIASALALMNSFAEVLVYKRITEKALLWLVLFWAVQLIS